MNEVVTANEIVSKVNELLNSGFKIMVYGLPFPPHQEVIVFTDPNTNRRGYLKTSSDLVLDVRGIINKLKVHTIMGWAPLFSLEEGGKYRLNIYKFYEEPNTSSSLFYAQIRDINQVMPGMLLGYKGENGVYQNLGMISSLYENVFDSENPLNKEDSYNITYISEGFSLYESARITPDSINKAMDSEDITYFVLDPII